MAERKELFKLVKGGMRSKDYWLRQLVCNKCGSKDFNISQDDYYTAARCVKCKIQEAIHCG